MITKTYKVFSYCNDFEEEEQEILQEYGLYDAYIVYTAHSEEYLREEGWDSDPISTKLFSLGAGEGEEVLIHLDW